MYTIQARLRNMYSTKLELGFRTACSQSLFLQYESNLVKFHPASYSAVSDVVDTDSVLIHETEIEQESVDIDCVNQHYYRLPLLVHGSAGAKTGILLSASMCNCAPFGASTPKRRSFAPHPKRTAVRRGVAPHHRLNPPRGS